MVGAMVKPDAAQQLSAPAADADLSRTDAFLAEQFRRSTSLAAIDIEALVRWWRIEGRPGASLAEFLTGAAILSPGAARTLEMVQKGYVQLPDAAQLLKPGAFEQLRNRHPAAAPQLPVAAPAIPVNSPTVVVTPEPACAGCEAPPALEIGSTLGKCLLTELLGQGGCGMVFRALHRGLNISVAVKVIQKQLLGSDPLVYQRLRGEARMLAQLNHPHIVRVLDFEEDASLPYVVMELVEGLSLAELIEQSGCLRLYKAVRTIGQVAQGLAAAQRFGIVHRDVKPANILLARDGTAKLADLGLAVAAAGRSPAQCLGVGEAHGELAGTVAYMAPEQFASPAAVDYRSDIYALGATFYHALTGRVPFTGATPMEVMIKHVEESPPPPHSLSPEASEPVTDLILRMMAKKPADRFQSYDEILAALIQLTTRAAQATDGNRPTAELLSSPTQANQLRSSRWKGLWSLITRERSASSKEEG